MPDEAKTLLAEHRALGERAFEEGRFREAERALRRAEDLAASLGTEEIARSAFELARTLAELDRHAEALDLCTKALQLRATSLQEPHPAIAECSTLRAKILLSLARPSEALPVATEALTQWRRLVDKDTPSLADDLCTLSSLAVVRGDLVSAEQYARRALSLFGEASTDRRELRALEALAAPVMIVRRDPAERTALTARIVERTDALLGADHPWRARSFIYFVLQGKASLAPSEMLAAEMSLVDRTVGTRHTLYAALLVAAGQFGLAGFRSKTMLEEALEIYQTVFGPKHPVIAWTLLSLGRFLSVLDKGEPDGDSERCSRDALEIAENFYGPEHPYLPYFLQEVGIAAGRRGSPDAELALSRALAIRGRDARADDPFLVELRASRAAARKATGDPAGALLDLEFVRNCRERGATPADVVATNLQEESEIHEALGALDRALALQRRAVALLEDDGSSDLSTIAALERLADLLERMGDAPGARDALERVAEITSGDETTES